MYISHLTLPIISSLFFFIKVKFFSIKSFSIFQEENNTNLMFSKTFQLIIIFPRNLLLLLPLVFYVCISY